MKKLFLLYLLFSYQAYFAYSQLTTHNSLPYFQQQVNYKINVTLNDAVNTLDGFEKMEYTNNSPDTLSYIWIHLWPNAYKNDKTAFSDQILQNGRTDFYFSDNEKRGYINRLDFTVNGISAKLEDHPQYIDVAKLILPLPLAPGQTINIATPFHEKIPYNFSRGGYVDHAYQITQWYPKPAVYDSKGWHAMPYLDQGEFYSEFGNFDVQITLPKTFVVAATGELQNEEEKIWLKEKSKENLPATGKEIIKPVDKKKENVKVQSSKQTTQKAKTPNKKANVKKIKPVATTNYKPQTTNSPTKTANSKPETKTLHYIQNNVHDFAWFADKTFLVRTDTLKLPSGKIINAFSYFTPSGNKVWKNSIQFIKDAVRTRSEWLGEYPYNVVTALEAKMGFSGGMEYPTITSISPIKDEKDLDLTIEHEVGHNWNYGILASNEREHPWMDEGMNTYFDNRYEENKYSKKTEEDVIYSQVIASKTDQPIETSSEKFSELNYNKIAYYKTGLWMKALENYVGKDVFDKCLHEYFNRWKFKHPYPEDFKKVVQDVSGKNVDAVFSLLNKTGELAAQKNKPVKLAPIFTLKQTDKYNYIFYSPSIGINHYDKLMLGAFIHNYTLPQNTFQFFAAAMYATGSKKIVGMARAEYNWMSYGTIRKIKASLNAASFTMNDFTDSLGNKKFLGFRKLVPSVKIILREKDPRSTVTKSLQWKTFFINEDVVLFSRDTIHQKDIITYPVASRYLNQLKFVEKNERALYPYSAELQAEQGKDFVRTTVTGNYFFNFSKGGGLDVRFFAGKFIYLGDKTFSKQYATDRYQLTLTGPKGYEDYTYSNYFTGRNEFEKISSQQIMIRDGGFKVRTDLLAAKIGKTDDWLSAINFTTDFPKKINPLQVLPVKIPVKIFFDIGTYADAWKKNATTGKFLYDAGLQISILKDLVNIYLPIAYSKVYRDYFKSSLGEKRFWKNISFSIDIQNFNLKKFAGQIPF